MNRRYGCWAGDPKGSAEDITRCIEEVSDSTGWHYHQCCRKRGHGPNGDYCKQHGKIAASRADREGVAE